ncbi:MAG: peptidase dimerization domain-containing protein [Caldilineaceae bacterium]
MEQIEAEEIATHGHHEHLGQPSITPTILASPVRNQGEPQNNVMPGATEVMLDCRLIPGQNPEALAEQVKARLQQVADRNPRLRFTFDVLEIRHPTETDPNHPVITTLASAYEDLTGNAPIYGGVPGSTDGTILNARKGIPIVTCGPGDILHSPPH